MYSGGQNTAKKSLLQVFNCSVLQVLEESFCRTNYEQLLTDPSGKVDEYREKQRASRHSMVCVLIIMHTSLPKHATPILKCK